MIYVEAFSEEHQNCWEYSVKPSLFLAGGISNCQLWQDRAVEMLRDTDLVVLNPRRKFFPMDDPTAANEQIRWEFDHLNKATMILFWFPPETLCPITLFEYGKWLVRPKTLFVGCDPEYKRLEDLRIQTALERPSQHVYTNLDELVKSVVQHQGGKI